MKFMYAWASKSVVPHPSEGPRSLSIQDKLVGAKNYRSWPKNMEIALVTKRKHGFVQGTIARPHDDPIKLRCGILVIVW